jgi:predicted nucleic acid-binding protein
MKLIITDTSVFFDIIQIQALPEFFALDLEICTTDFVEREIMQSDQREQIELFKRSKQLTVFTLSPEEIEEVKLFQTNRFFKTLPDKTVLWKAKQLKCPLLTCDGKLRNEATEQGITVYGSIWVVITLVEATIISNQKGIDFLEKLKLINDRLPFDEIEKLIKKLKS